MTSQQEADDGFSRMPDRSLRLKSERLVHDSSSEEEDEEDADKENETEATEEFIVGKKTPPKRKNEHAMVDIYNKSDLIDIEQKGMISGLSEMLFSRKKTGRTQKAEHKESKEQEEIRRYKYREDELDVIEEHVEEVEVFNDEEDSLSFDSIDYDDEKEYAPKLEDFKIIKVLDKGSFGKVFLAENKLNGRLYAMKRIRKDVLIEK